jgi:hypothetical protein
MAASARTPRAADGGRERNGSFSSMNSGGFDSVRRKRSLKAIYALMCSFCQDRLGTNIGNALKNRTVVFAAILSGYFVSGRGCHADAGADRSVLPRARSS